MNERLSPGHLRLWSYQQIIDNFKKKQNNIVFYNWFYHFSATSKHIAVKENTQGMSLTKQHIYSGVVFCQGDLNMTVLLIEKILFSENVMISCWIRSPSKGFS